MTKKKFGLKNTLKRNQQSLTEELAPKTALPKKEVNEAFIKGRVEEIHAESQKENDLKIKKISKTKTEKNVRITVDLPESIHIALKTKTVQQRITIKKHLINLIKKDLKI